MPKLFPRAGFPLTIFTPPATASTASWPPLLRTSAVKTAEHIALLYIPGHLLQSEPVSVLYYRLADNQLHPPRIFSILSICPQQSCPDQRPEEISPYPSNLLHPAIMSSRIIFLRSHTSNPGTYAASMIMMYSSSSPFFLQGTGHFSNARSQAQNDLSLFGHFLSV